MKTKVLLFKEAKNQTSLVKVEHPEGGIYILGFNRVIPLSLKDEYSKAICLFTDNFVELAESNYLNYMAHRLSKHMFLTPAFAGPDRNADRERIGQRIKELREEMQLDAKTLAQKAGITPANISRIEQGKYSPGLDILCRVAAALGMKLDFVKKGGSK